jgi:hypothetical protein
MVEFSPDSPAFQGEGDRRPRPLQNPHAIALPRKEGGNPQTTSKQISKLPFCERRISRRSSAHYKISLPSAHLLRASRSYFDEQSTPTLFPVAQPNLELTEELLSLLWRLYLRMVTHKLLKSSFLILGLAVTKICEPLVGGRKTGPSRDGCSKVHRLPKWVTRRFQEFAELREECLDELCGPFVSYGIFWPVE